MKNSPINKGRMPDCNASHRQLNCMSNNMLCNPQITRINEIPVIPRKSLVSQNSQNAKNPGFPANSTRPLNQDNVTRNTCPSRTVDTLVVDMSIVDMSNASVETSVDNLEAVVETAKGRLAWNELSRKESHGNWSRQKHSRGFLVLPSARNVSAADRCLLLLMAVEETLTLDVCDVVDNCRWSMPNNRSKPLVGRLGAWASC